jgi:glycine betaine/proline transport system ATP-binding protein
MFGPAPPEALDMARRGRHALKSSPPRPMSWAWHDCTLEVEEGEILVLMGLSGSGKSTLLRAVNGLNPVARGGVEVRAVGGRMVDVDPCRGELRRLRQADVAMVFQAVRPAALAHRAGERGPSGWSCRVCPGRSAARVDRQQLELVGLERLGRPQGGMSFRAACSSASALPAPLRPTRRSC